MPPGFCAVLESEIQPYKDKKKQCVHVGIDHCVQVEERGQGRSGKGDHDFLHSMIRCVYGTRRRS